MEEEDELMSDIDGGSDDPESEEGIDPHAEEGRFRKEARRIESHKDGKRAAKGKSTRSAPYPNHTRNGQQPTSMGPSYRMASSHSTRIMRPWDEEADADGEADAEGDSYIEDENSASRSVMGRAPAIRRLWPVGLADLDSPSGRWVNATFFWREADSFPFSKNFIFASVDHLFATTYESSDDMSISALLTYLNAAMPQDKHEDFDTSEVIKAASALQEKGRIAFEGDMLRLVD